MRASLQSRSTGYFAGIFGIAAVTALCCLLRNYINEMTVALALLLVVLFVATRWEYWPALVASVAGMLCLNYFFLPPIYTFTIEDPKNWLALSAFFVVAVTVGRLSGRLKQKAAEADAGRKKANQLARLQAVVAELGQQALRSEPSETVFNEAVRRAAEILDVDYARVLELLPDGKTLLLRAGYGWKPGVVGTATVSASPETQAGYTLISKEPVILEDLRTEKRFTSVPMFGEPQVISGMSTVISTGDGPYGIYSVHTRERRTFTEDEINFLQAVANVLGTMIERQRADAALQRSADEIRDLYDRAPCGYHSLDKEGIFVQINETELSWLGYTRDEVIGKLNFVALLSPRTLKTFEESFPKFKQRGTIRDLEFELLRKDGSALPVLLSATAVTDNAGNYIMSRSTMFDITKRKRAEEEARMLAELQSVVADLGERALRGASLSEVLDDAAYQARRALDVDYCKVLELLPNQDALLLVAGAGWRPGYVGHATVGIGRDSQAGFTLLAGEPVIVENLQTEKRFEGTAILHEHQVVSGATVVISTQQGPYGVLGVHTRQRRAFSADEVNFLQAVANVIGSTIERQRNEAQLWRVNQAQRVLSKCNESLIRATEEPALLQRICDLIVAEAGYRFCWVGRAENDDAKSVRPVAQAGFEGGYLSTLNITWADTDRGRGPTGSCIRTRRTVVMKRIASDPEMAPWRSEALKRGYQSSISIPLAVDSRVFGALMIYAAEPDAFGEEEVSLLGELASDLAFGIQTIRTRRHIQLLLDSTAEAICGLDSEGNCTWVNKSCVRMLGYSGPDALLGKSLHNIAHYARADGTPVMPDNCPVSIAGRKGLPAHVDDDVMWRADGQPFPVEFWLHPMHENGANVGAVVTFLDITERKRAAQLQAANQAMEQTREREIDIGFRIQETLLLDEPPQDVPGVQVAALTIPSQRIDGDFYGFFRHSEQNLDLIVGDVMGKGIPAALLGAATKSHFIRAFGDLSLSAKPGTLPQPREIVMLAHAELARHLMDLDSFVTLVYARIEEVNHRAVLVDCGHTGTIHLHGKTGMCDIVRSENLPLGVREGELYDQISVPFEPGDLLLFYSDGISESRNARGELFGAERLQELVRKNAHLDSAALVQVVRSAVSAFSGSDRFTDDLTTVVVKAEHVEPAIAHQELDLDSDLKSLYRTRTFVRDFCAEVPKTIIDDDGVGALELAVNEAASNIMKHAYHGRTDQRIHLEADAVPGRIAIRLHHFGDPFDPAKAAPPPLDGSRESGFGAFIIKNSVDEVRYYRDDRGRNCVALIKFAKAKNHQKGTNGNGNPFG